MKALSGTLDGPILIEPDVIGDDRGFFFESWNAARFAEAGIPAQFVQDNHAMSGKGVLRGLHFQQPRAQGKLVRCVAGAIFDVAVDLRRASPGFGQWAGYELSADNKRQLWVPAGFAHGYLALADATQVLYKTDAYYAPQHEHVLAWDDPDLAIDWPLDGNAPVLSAKDRAGQPLAALEGYA